MTLIKNTSIKTFCVLSVVLMLVGIILPLSASADLIFSPLEDVLVDTYKGVSPISAAEGEAVYKAYYEGLENEVDIMLYFEEHPEYNNVAVYDMTLEGNPLIDILYYAEDGLVHSAALGWSYEVSDDLIATVAAGVNGVFDMASAGFGFLTGNDLCMLMIAVTLAGVGIGFVAKGFKTARK